jgi:hypothetical protein
LRATCVSLNACLRPLFLTLSLQHHSQTIAYNNVFVNDFVNNKYTSSSGFVDP